MLIKRLTLHNFGVYAGTNTYDFNSDKPIVLIGGKNGRGKTTFLEAILIALYGANAFTYRESKEKTYGQYLRTFVNVSDGTKETYLELELSLEEDESERYLVRREWNANKERVKEVTTVFKNGEVSSFLTDNWALFIENVLPSGLSSFFFFDGEKIAELAAEDTNVHMKKSIKALLGITVLDSLEKDIRKVVKRMDSSVSDETVEELERLRLSKEKAENDLAECDVKLSEYDEKISDLNRKLDDAKAEYARKGGDVVNKRQELCTQKSELNLKKIQVAEKLYGLASGNFPLYLVYPLLKSISKQAELEHESKALDIVVRKVEESYKKYSKNCIPRNVHAISDFVEYINNEALKSKTNEIYNLTDQGLYQVKTLVNGQLEDTFSDVNHALAKLDELQVKIDEIDRFLSVEVDEKALPAIYKKMMTLKQEIIDFQVLRDRESSRRAELNGIVIRVGAEYKRCVDSYVDQIEIVDAENRITKYSLQAERILNEYRIRLQKSKISKLATTMTSCYKRLASKSNLIKYIDINGETLDMEYIGVDGNSIPKTSLSAGEKQLMVVSLLWALAICSKKRLPVIIDTPLSRLDSDHRVALIKTYFPNASAQTIILSTDSEIDKNYYQLMKDNVGDEFTLIYDDEDRCSTIKRGYFDYD